MWQLWLLAAAGSWGGAQFYHHVTPRDRAALMAGEELVFRADAPDPERRLPAGWGHQLLLSMPVGVHADGRDMPVGSAPGYQFDELRLGVHRTELGEVTLKVGLWAAQGNSRQ